MVCGVLERAACCIEFRVEYRHVLWKGEEVNGNKWCRSLGGSILAFISWHIPNQWKHHQAACVKKKLIHNYNRDPQIHPSSFSHGQSFVISPLIRKISVFAIAALSSPFNRQHCARSFSCSDLYDSPVCRWQPFSMYSAAGVIRNTYRAGFIWEVNYGY